MWLLKVGLLLSFSIISSCGEKAKFNANEQKSKDANAEARMDLDGSFDAKSLSAESKDSDEEIKDLINEVLKEILADTLEESDAPDQSTCEDCESCSQCEPACDDGSCEPACDNGSCEPACDNGSCEQTCDDGSCEPACDEHEPTCKHCDSDDGYGKDGDNGKDDGYGHDDDHGKDDGYAKDEADAKPEYEGEGCDLSSQDMQEMITSSVCTSPFGRIHWSKQEGRYTYTPDHEWIDFEGTLNNFSFEYDGERSEIVMQGNYVEKRWWFGSRTPAESGTFQFVFEVSDGPSCELLSVRSSTYIMTFTDSLRHEDKAQLGQPGAWILDCY